MHEIKKTKLSENALTSASLVYSVQFLMIAVGVGTAVGLNALLSRRIGEHKPDEACQAATTGLILMPITSLIFSVIGIFFSDTIAKALTPDIELQELCRQYLSINLVYYWGIFLQTYGQRLLQAVGDTVLSMISLIIGALLNIVLDPIMIFGFFGCPAMGIRGAAIATVIGQMTGLLPHCCLIASKIRLFTLTLTITISTGAMSPISTASDCRQSLCRRSEAL